MKYERPEISRLDVAQGAIQDSQEKPGTIMLDSSSPNDYAGTVNAYAADE